MTTPTTTETEDIGTRLAVVETEVRNINTNLAEMNANQRQVNDRIDRLQSDMTTQFSQVNSRIDRLLYLLLGGIITTMVGIITILGGLALLYIRAGA